MDEPSIVFIIAYVYNKNFISYINYYIDNINRFYKNAAILIVDNNPNNPDKFNITKSNNITIIPNNTNCKLEVGAYKCGLNYLQDNNLLYDYYICTQETFIIKNKYDFNFLKNSNIKACTIYSFNYDYHDHEYCCEILNKIGLYHTLEDIMCCWCNSFILHQTVINEFLFITKDIILTEKRDSHIAERYLGAILYKLNDYKNFDIDGNMKNRNYDCWSVNLLDNNHAHYFMKRVQLKPI